MNARPPNEDDPVTLKDACDRVNVYYTAANAAAYLGKTAQRLYQWVKEHPDAHGKTFGVKVGGKIMFSGAEISRIRIAMEEHQPGLVYFIEAGDYIKIGYTCSPVSRVRRMTTDSPFEIRVLHTESGTYKWEKAMQRQFAAICVRREWFHKTPELLAYIEHRKLSKIGVERT